jgi:hypothetical protein
MLTLASLVPSVEPRQTAGTSVQRPMPLLASYATPWSSPFTAKESVHASMSSVMAIVSPFAKALPYSAKPSPQPFLPVLL